MRKLLLTAFVLLITISVFGIEKKTFLYSVKGSDSLYLDLYQAEVKGNSGPTPCVIFCFGGGFIMGARDDSFYDSYFKYLNEEKGYSVVSIDYRLGLKNLSPDDMSLSKMVPKLKYSVDIAVEDLFDATLYVLNHAKDWNINKELIMTSGSSAGAITVLQGENEICNQSAIAQKLPAGFNYAGVISFAGALVKVGEKCKWKSTPCPILMFHGDADKNVPYYKTGIGKAGLFGSKYISEQLQELGASYYFYSAENRDHIMALSPMNENRELIDIFVKEYVMRGKRLQRVEVVRDLSLPDLPNSFKAKEYITTNFVFPVIKSDEELLKEAEELHKKIFSIDTHNDAALRVNHPERKVKIAIGQVAFPLMREGGLDASTFAVYLSPGKRDDASLEKAINKAETELTKFKEYLAKQGDSVAIAYRSDDFLPFKAQGKSIVLLAIENGYAIGKDINNVQKFYDMGVRAMTLSHNKNNDICDSSQDKEPEWNGLSPFGYEVVKKMNELGMMVDVSHVGSATLWDVLEFSKAPVIATHSCVRNLMDSPRNLKDEEIVAIAKKGGLIQITTVPSFLSTKPYSEVNLQDMMNHIDYVKNLVGIEHVGIGTDYDGGGGFPGLENASKMKYLTVEMLKRGYTHEEIALFWGGNFLRFMKEVERVASNK